MREMVQKRRRKEIESVSLRSLASRSTDRRSNTDRTKFSRFFLASSIREIHVKRHEIAKIEEEKGDAVISRSLFARQLVSLLELL